MRMINKSVFDELTAQQQLDWCYMYFCYVHNPSKINSSLWQQRFVAKSIHAAT